MMCCYYPTTTVAIDDDHSFLSVLAQHLDMNNCRTYQSPMVAINTIKHLSPITRLQKRILKPNASLSENNTAPEDQTINYNLRGLHEEIHHAGRLNDISVIIVDYYMDELNGIETCEALAKHPAKKILLTGGADKENLAITAFNKEIIHRFISKSDPDFANKLTLAVTQLKDAYFKDISAALLPKITSASCKPFQSPIFEHFVENIHKQFNTVEFYLIDTNGSRLMLDTNSHPTWLIIKTETEMNALAQLADDMDAPAPLISKIEGRSLMPVFLTEEDYQQPASEWEQLSSYTQSIPGMKGYYYTIVQNRNVEVSART